MKTDPVTLTFDSQFVGQLTSPSGTILLGNQPQGMEPYHLLYGALGSCFYATFLGIVEKKRLTFTRAKLQISGTKRDNVPPTLEKVTIELEITNPSKEEPFRVAAQLGAQHCSIHETISKVATMELVVKFVVE